jgi:hypothetical protein
MDGDAPLDHDEWLERARDLGALLTTRGLTYEVLVVGGFALQHHDLLIRELTMDVDTLARREGDVLVSATPEPRAVREAIEAVANARGIDRRWMNARVAAELFERPLPDGIDERATRIEIAGLTLLVAHPDDLVKLKLAAAAKQFAPRDVDEKHRGDLRGMCPTREQLTAGLDWIAVAWGDGSPLFDIACGIVEDDHG